MFKRTKALRLLAGAALSLGLVGFSTGCDDDDFEDFFEEVEEWWDDGYHHGDCCNPDFGFDFWYF